ncbi:glycosyltransferase family 2 protein [Flavobacterium psychrotrophum]|uniref:glycosyltransferase family 2 protein n=1 Tax=Flavobacterium psychrotrophum TaxID=2294119 RepID=UPI000E319971|nr:glycosyltransferase family 2 protein [Flavobacterium psychrotrophum]
MDKNVFVIIVTYNGARWIDKNIQSLLASSYPVRIIAIDNQSTDNSVALLKQYPEVQVIESDSNLGFGKANNIGMKLAIEQGADYLFLLNQDAWVFKDTVKSLVHKMEANTQLGLLSPMHYVANETDLDVSFSTYLNRKSGDLNRIPLVPFVNAAAWMLSSDCVKKVGYFEPLFGHYGEDRNYCDRVLYHKFLIGIDTDAKIVHDRVITRNFNKDTTQSKYKILATLIDPNRSIFNAYKQGLKEALGLPKYFSKFYSKAEARKMLGTLLKYYANHVFNTAPIKVARKNAL